MLKRTIIWVVGACIGLAIAGIVVVGLGVGNEASALHDTLEQAVNQHLSRDQVSQKLSGMKLDIASAKSATDLMARGNTHSLFVYGTWLTVDVKFDAQDKANGYHLDRASQWF